MVNVGKYTSPMDSMAFQKGYTPIFDPSCFVPTEGTQVMALVGTAKSNRNFTSNSTKEYRAVTKEYMNSRNIWQYFKWATTKTRGLLV